MKHIFLKLPEEYSFLKITNVDEWGGRNNPFKLLCLRDLHDHEITNNVYTENLVLESNCRIKISNKAKLQIQNEITTIPIYYLEKPNEFAKDDINKNIFKINHYDRGAKNNPIYNLIVENDTCIEANEEIFIQNLIMNNRCRITLKNCKVNITESISISEELKPILGSTENSFE